MSEAPSHPEVPPPGSPSHPETPPPGGPSHPDVPPPGSPDQSLPPIAIQPLPPTAPTHPIPPMVSHPITPGGPVDPAFGVPLPPVIDNSLPDERPPHVSTGPVRPTFPVDPSYGLPSPPTVWPNPPEFDGGVEQPIRLPPLVPGYPIFLPPPEISNDLPPGGVWPPLPDDAPDILVALVWVVGYGYRYAVLDNSVELPIAGTPQPKKAKHK